MCHNSKTDAEGRDGKEMRSWGSEDIKSSMKLGLQGLAVNPLGTYCKDPWRETRNICARRAPRPVLRPFKRHFDLGNCVDRSGARCFGDDLKSDQILAEFEVQDAGTVRMVVDASRLAASSTWSV